MLVFGAAILVLAACAPQPAERLPQEPLQPDGFPEQTYLDAAAEGRPVFRIDPASSIVVVEVRRAGSLARLGHDHVVASHDVRGYVEPDAGRADLYVALDRLVVDEPELRKQAHLDTEPTAEAIAGTRHNMLEKTLEADRYPFASIGVRRAAGSAAADVSLSLHGMTRTMQVPLTVKESPEAIEVMGDMALRQTDFGISPLSIAGGAIQVQDELKLRFDIRARRMHGASAGPVTQAPAIPEVVAPGVPSPTSVVDAMMQLAGVGADDYVVDLGSGDGRIVIAAVARYRARGGFGVDVNPVAVAQANENAIKAGVADRVQFHERDLFATDVRDATVVTIYLLPSIMGKVEQKLRAELKPGTRIVVHDFPFPEWRPEKTIVVESLDKLGFAGFALSQLYLYRVPPRR